MRHGAKFHGDRSNHYRDIAISRPSAILSFRNFGILAADRLKRTKCVITPNSVAIDQTVAEVFRFFKDGGRSPSWIYDARVSTTHEEHLVAFITLQNLVGIDTVVLIICKF